MNSLLVVALGALGLAGFLVGLLLLVVHIKYTPVIVRIFADAPPMQPLRVEPQEGGEDVIFPAPDGVALAGTYFPCRTSERKGVIIFCHEYLSDRWSVQPYLGDLLNEGFDLFTFDFRGHGDSESEPGVAPIQWVSDRDVRDLEAAVAYLSSREDADPRGWGIFGISRGGGAAICLAAREPRIWGVVTDGAFGTRLTMYKYIVRWAEIYVPQRWMAEKMPHFVFHFAGWMGRRASEKRLRRRFLNVEDAVGKLAPRPWLSIHGEKDAYIGVEIARDLFDHGRSPKEFWVVPEAKHNRCREADPEGYRSRLLDFYSRAVPGRAMALERRRSDLAPVQPREELDVMTMVRDAAQA